MKEFGYILNGPTPPSLGYLRNYPKEEKSWYDMDFTLWNTPLARIQIICSCRSGAQLCSCCAHGSSTIWLIYYAIFGDIDKALESSKRDQEISNGTNIVDLTEYAAYLKIRGKRHNICVKCKKETDETTMLCDGCHCRFHPKCAGTTLVEIQRDKYHYNIWHCRQCNTDEVWCARKQPKPKAKKSAT